MKCITLLTVSIIIVIAQCQVHAQLPEDVVGAASERIENKPGSGIIIGVIEPGRVQYYNMNGNEGGTNVITPTTIVEIGSITKVFTALIASKMIEEGKLKLREPISSYLPDGKQIPDNDGIEISVMNILNHTSGLPRLPDNLEPANVNNPYKKYTVSDAYNFLEKYTLTRSPGERYEYSNLGFALMGLALEHTAGKPYSQLVNEYITAPLNMQSSWLQVPDTKTGILAIPHFDSKEVPYWDMGIFAAAGGIKSTPEDMVQFIKAHLGRFEHPLQSANELASAPMFATDIPFTSIGLGWHVRNSSSANVIWHNGGTGGFRSFVGYDPGQDKGVVVFVNNGAIDPTDIGLRILDETQPVERFPQKIVVTNELLQTYVGTYELTEDFSITITVRGNRIFAQATNQDSFEIYPETETKFNYRITVASIEFLKENGSVTGLNLHQNNRDFYGKKTK